MRYVFIVTVLLFAVYGCKGEFEVSPPITTNWESNLTELSGHPVRAEPRKLDRVQDKDSWEKMRIRSLGQHQARFELSYLDRTKQSYYCALILTNKETGKDRLLLVHDAPWTDDDLPETHPKILVSIYPDSIRHDLLTAENWVVAINTDFEDNNPGSSRIEIPNLASFNEDRRSINFSGGKFEVSGEPATRIAETDLYRITLLDIVYNLYPSKSDG